MLKFAFASAKLSFWCAATPPPRSEAPSSSGQDTALSRRRRGFNSPWGHQAAGRKPGPFAYTRHVDYRERIVADPEVLGGRARIKGTRIPVATVLLMLAQYSPEEVLRYYPELTQEDLKAVLAYAADLAEERVLQI